MSNLYDERLTLLLERLPKHLSLEQGDGNYEMLSLIAKSSVEIREAYDTVLKFWDVDTSIGNGLDRLGKDEGISRGGWDDEEYRKMIKIQCIVNLSEGDIETMNIILDAYMDERFIGLEDGWKHVEPASLLSNVTPFAGELPNYLISRIKSAGVRFFWQVKFEMQKLIMTHFPYHYPIYYHKCGELITAPILGMGIGSIIGLPDLQYRYPVYYNPADTLNTAPTPGANLSSDLSFIEHQYDYPNYYRPTDTFQTQGVRGAIFEGGAQLTDNQYDYPNYYPMTNVVESENFLKGAFSDAKTNLQQATASMRMMAPICGNFTGGGM